MLDGYILPTMVGSMICLIENYQNSYWTGGVYLRDHEGIPIRYGKTYTIKGYFKVSRTPFTASPYNFTINGNPGNKYYNCGKSLPLTTE